MVKQINNPAGPLPKADVAVAILAKDSARTIAACLDSVVPFVKEVLVCVDSRSKDKTPTIAKKHGARVIADFRVSDYHECPNHGKILAQNFAEARNHSFALLCDDTEWLMWIDSDDVLIGGDKLKGFLDSLPQQVAGVWLDYHYSRTPTGITATLFQRERILRRSVGWHWEHRVHEIAAPNNQPAEHLQWTSIKDINVVHQHLGHDTAGSAHRNILLLEIDLEENPEDSRALFYLGNQYFALEKWDAAAHYYSQSVKTTNPYQAWQTWIYLSMALEKLQDFEGSLKAAYRAVDVVPYHPEPYLRLASMAMYARDVQRCEFWTRLAEQMHEAPFFAFKNPLDVPYNSKLTLSQAYANDGQISKARRELAKAIAVMPLPDIVKGHNELAKLEQETQDAESFLRVLSMSGESSPRVPNQLWKFGRVRDVVVPNILSNRPSTQPRIIFWCGRSLEHWSPRSINTGGIGGSETAVIEIAARFARDGWRVDVYNEPDYLEGEYEQVGYWGLNRLQANESADVLVGWRNPEAYNLPNQRKVSLLWMHDLNRGPSGDDHYQRWDQVLGVSRWHADYLQQVYQLDRVDFVPNGIDLARFSADVKRVPFRCVYASSPDRGLARLLRMWPAIAAEENMAELHIAYGWDTIDQSIAAGFDPKGTLQLLKAEIVELIGRDPRIIWRGRLPQDELAKLYQESYCWLYPTSFLEVSCISAMEAMAAGCVPVVSTAGALPETINDSGLLVTGNTYTYAWQEFYIHCAKAALRAPDVRKPLAMKAQQRAQSLTWDTAYEKWKDVVTAMLEVSKEQIPA